MFGFLGPNGAGKTTTIRIMMGILVPSSGRVAIDGLDCQRDRVEVKRRVGYLPDKRVVGISKLARVVDAYALRLQIQEKLTAQIANTLQEVLQPRGVAVVIEAAHQCMTTRGVHKSDVTMVTSRMLGAFRDNGETRREFLSMIGRTSI